MSTLFLSRFTLSREPEVEALSALLNPNDVAMRLDAHHRLLWSAFAGDPDARRDFLWREMGNGRFMVLSHRPPKASPFFDEPDVKELTLELMPGDRLSFLLRANATRTVKSGRRTATGAVHKVHRDVVMALLHEHKERPRELRESAARNAAREWLGGQGERAGFALLSVDVKGYVQRALRPLHDRRKGCPQFGILDLEGEIEITEPSLFLPRLARGFGRAKAFGCGLMLVRRN